MKHLRTLLFGIVLAGSMGAWRCGGSAVTSVTGPTATRCVASVTNSSSSFGSSGGSGTLSISIDRECSWSASSPVSWIQLASAASGQGAGSVSYQVGANPDPVVRQTAITAANQQESIAQAAAPCLYSMTGPAGALPGPGGSTTIGVQTNSACSWSAKPSDAWVSVSPSSGAGPATLTVVADANTGAARTATIAVGSDSVVVEQLAAPPSPAPTPAPDPSPAPTPPPGPGPSPSPDPPPPPQPPSQPSPPLPLTVDLTGKIAGLRGKCPTIAFTLDGAAVQATRATDYSGGECRDLKDDLDVEVRGTETADTVTADTIAIKKGHH